MTRQRTRLFGTGPPSAWGPYEFWKQSELVVFNNGCNIKWYFIYYLFLPYFDWCCVIWLVHLVSNMSDHVFHKFRLVDKTCTISCWHCPSTKKKKIAKEKKRVGNIFIWRTWQLVIWKSKPRAKRSFRKHRVTVTFEGTHSWGQLHLKTVRPHKPHQPESGHRGRQTVQSGVCHLRRKKKFWWWHDLKEKQQNLTVQYWVFVFPDLYYCNKGWDCQVWIDNKCEVQHSLSLVVNSLSLALADLMKSQATIIGVKQTSQSYFLTKDLNASLLEERVVLITELMIWNPKV